MRSSLWLFPIVIVNLTALHAEENRAKPQWKKVAVEQTGLRLGAMLVSDHAQQKMYLVGEAKNAQSKLVYVLNFRGEAFVIKLKP